MFTPLTQSFTRTSTRSFGKNYTRARDAEGLTDDAIRAVAPSIFAAEPHSSRSARYTYIPTIDVLNGLRNEGFVPVEVRQGGSRDEEKVNFTKHLIRLRHESAPALVRGDSIRELVLLNSHDGTTSYQLMSGLFRIVCANGLITCEQGELQRIAHKGDIVNNVIEGAFTIIENSKNVEGKVDAFAGIELNPREQEIFAESALQLKYHAKDENGNIKSAPIAPYVLNNANRSADHGNDLWKTFNRVQENLLRGGQGYTTQTEDGRISHRNTRPVNSVDGNVGLNRALWTLATKFAELKAN